MITLAVVILNILAIQATTKVILYGNLKRWYVFNPRAEDYGDPSYANLGIIHAVIGLPVCVNIYGMRDENDSESAEAEAMKQCIEIAGKVGCLQAIVKSRKNVSGKILKTFMGMPTRLVININEDNYVEMFELLVEQNFVVDMVVTEW